MGQVASGVKSLATQLGPRLHARTAAKARVGPEQRWNRLPQSEPQLCEECAQRTKRSELEQHAGKGRGASATGPPHDGNLTKPETGQMVSSADQPDTAEEV